MRIESFLRQKRFDNKEIQDRFSNSPEIHKIRQEYSKLYRELEQIIKDQTYKMSELTPMPSRRGLPPQPPDPENEAKKKAIVDADKPRIDELRQQMRDLEIKVESAADNILKQIMSEKRDKYISEIETNHRTMLRDIVSQPARSHAIHNFIKGLDTTREAYERIEDPDERRDTLARFDAVAEKIKASHKGGRKSRKPKKGKKVRKTRRLVRK